MRSGSFVQLSGKKSRKPTITGTSRDAYRVISLLGQRRIIDDEKSRLIASQGICLLQQRGLEWSTVANSARDEMMKLIVIDLGSARLHRLNALAVPWAD